MVDITSGGNYFKNFYYHLDAVIKFNLNAIFRNLFSSGANTIQAINKK